MSYTHTDQKPGDVIRSADWNQMSREVMRLGTDKVDRTGSDTLTGPLTVKGDLGVGTTNAGAQLRVYRRQEDGSDGAHGALVVGSDSDSSASLRLGYGAGYSWIQGKGRPALALNPHGGDVGVGTDAPRSRLSVAGGLSVGAAWAAATAAPASSLIVEGNAGIGVAAPAERLEVAGDVVAGGAPGTRFRFHTRGANAGDFLQIAPDSGNGAWDWSKGLVIQRATGNVGVGTTAPQEKLEVNGAALIGTGSNFANRSRYMAAGSLTVGGINVNYGGGKGWNANTAGLLLETLDNTEIAVHDSGERVASLLYYQGGAANRLTLGRDMGWGAIGRVVVNGDLEVTGLLRTTGNPLAHRMYPADPVVYQDIFDARDRGAIRKIGNPAYDETSYSVNSWFARRLIKYGGNNEADDNGAEVTIPAGYDTVWVRVLGDRWTAIKAYFRDGGRENVGLYTGGYRSANGYCPDGSLSDGFNDASHEIEGGSKLQIELHQWVPIPVRRAGVLALVSKPNSNWDFWLSGLAFSRNPWAHAAQSAVGYHWALNGGEGQKWNNHNWNQDVLAELTAGAEHELMVPVVPSGREKLLYLVEHNSSWNGTGHTGITVNNRPVERFLATWNNPFARHWSGKIYERYIAARIPADLIGTDRFLKVRIDMRKQNSSIHFREIGTHDLEVPLPA